MEMLDQECGNAAGEWKNLKCLTSNTPSSYLLLLSAATQLCVCVLFLCMWRSIWPVRVSGLHRGQGHVLCVCFIRSDVGRELECKHLVKLCLLSSRASLMDSPLEPALITYQVLHHEGSVGRGGGLYLDRTWSYLNRSLRLVTFSNISSPFGRHPSKPPCNFFTACIRGVKHLAHGPEAALSGDPVWLFIWFRNVNIEKWILLPKITTSPICPLGALFLRTDYTSS